MALEHFASFPDEFLADVVVDLLHRAGIRAEIKYAMDSGADRSSRVSLFVEEDQLFLAEEALHQMKKKPHPSGSVFIRAFQLLRRTGQAFRKN